MKYYYLDNAATTPLSKEALQAMLPYLTEDYGNASTIYTLGQRAKRAV
ncbi:MAG TPA: cysteine desulfurase NifS, partial [Oribacterium sp.]|nr:cysteine desulfurase NifS [Oribacterium sp.]